MRTQLTSFVALENHCCEHKKNPRVLVKISRLFLLPQTLNTTSIGRLVIYCDVVSSSMRVMSGNPPLVHGLVVIPTQQTHGQGKTVLHHHPLHFISIVLYLPLVTCTFSPSVFPLPKAIISHFPSQRLIKFFLSVVSFI